MSEIKLNDEVTTAVVIPCYNESKRLQVEHFMDFIETHENIAFLFVNDGSQDNTIEILNRLSEHRSGRISALDLKNNQGKAEAVRQGMLHAFDSGFQYAGYLDADLATPLESIIEFEKLLNRMPEVWMVIGSRVQLLGREIRRKKTRHYLGRIFATVVSILLKLPVYDTQCGAKFFRNNAATRSVFQRKFVSRWIFDVEIIKHIRSIQVSNQNSIPAKRIYEMPLDKWQDIAGSKLKPRDFLKAFIELFQITRLDLTGEPVEIESFCMNCQ
jgi:glycosyltransferase involved in cell wall biosynthesis